MLKCWSCLSWWGSFVPSILFGLKVGFSLRPSPSVSPINLILRREFRAPARSLPILVSTVLRAGQTKNPCSPSITDVVQSRSTDIKEGTAPTSMVKEIKFPNIQASNAPTTDTLIVHYCPQTSLQRSPYITDHG